MSIPEQFPEDRGNGAPAAPQGAAGVLAGFVLPAIEPFGADSPALAGLPDFPPVPAVVPEPPSRNGGAFGVHCAGIEALEAYRIHQAKLDAFRVRAAAQVRGAAEVEWAAAKLDRFQRRAMDASIAAELAMALCIPERTAASLDHNAGDLVNEYPSVLAGMEAGSLCYGHATVILSECRTLEITDGVTAELMAAFLAKLLKIVAGTTVAAFKGKARRARERMCPESLDTRTKEAWARRNVSCETGPDGMSWLTLHLPTLSATAIYTYLTRLARAVKYDAATSDRLNKNRHPGTTEDLRDHRTLDQRRADIATLLLLHQDPTNPGNDDTSPATMNTGGTSFGAGNAGFSNSLGGGDGADSGNSFPPTKNTPPNHRASPEGLDGLDVPDVPDGSGSPDGDDEPPWAHSAPPPGTPPHHPTSPDGTTGPGGPEIHGGAGVPGMREDVLEGVVLPEGACFTTGQDFFDEVVGDGSGFTPDRLVDGIPEEEPWQEYREQLERLQHGNTMTAPPLPQGLFILTVPILSLFGLTNEPAEIAGAQGGLLPASIARELTARAPALLRILTDPVTGDALPLHPQRYTLTKTEKTALRALKGGCYMPNCPNPVMETDLDHLRAFEFGGASTIANLAPACEAHHRLRHLKDDKDKNGQRRAINEPERHTITLRGWTPQPTPDGRVGWTTPTGRYQPPTPNDPARPEYPHWLQQLITQTTKTQRT